MSHPLYNPCATGSQGSTQRQYGFSSTQTGRDLQTASLHLRPGSSFVSSTASSEVSENSGRMLPSSMPQTLGYRSEQARTKIDEDIGRTVDLHISRAREEVRGLGKQMPHHTGQGTGFTGTQRDDFSSSGTGTTYSSLTSTAHRHSDLQSGSNSFDWLSKYEKPTSNSSKLYSSSASSSHAERDLQYFPGLGGYGYKKPEPHAETAQPEHTTESAINILRQHGLEKEDLEHLISYPEDQMTPANLPFILRQIRIQKAKTTAKAGQSKPFPEPHPSASMSGMASQNLSTSGVSGISPKGMSSAILQPRKVIDYGHTSKFPGGIVDETESTSDNGNSESVSMNTYDKSRSSQEQPHKDTAKTKSPVLGSSVDQASTVTSLSSVKKSTLNSVVPQSKPNQTPKTSLSSSQQVLKSETSKPSAIKEPKADHQPALKTQQAFCTPLHGMHPGRPGLVLISRNEKNGNPDKSKRKDQGSPVAEQTKKQQMQRLPVEQQSKHQMLKEPALHVEQATWPPVFSAAKPHPVAGLIPSITSASQTMHHPAFSPDPISNPPAMHQLPPAPVSQTNSKNQSTGKNAVSKGLPAPAMIHDYAATTPRFFPHTCSLCLKECTQMQDWISHQNTSLHLESCKLLRRQYPNWNGQVTLEARDAGKYINPTSGSTEASKNKNQKAVHGSHSHSPSFSLHSQHGSEGKREKRSKSRSPHSTRYTRRSPKREGSPSWRGDRHSPQRRSEGRWSSPRRSREERSPPRRVDYRRSPPRRVDDRLSPPRWLDKRRSPLRWGGDRRSPQRRLNEKRSSPKRVEKKQLSPKKSDKRWLSPKRSNERQLLRKTSSEKRSSTEASTSQQGSSDGKSKQPDLDAMVKNLANALMVEISKMKSSSSSSSSSSKGAIPSAGGKKSSSAASSSSSCSSSVKKPSSKPSLDKSGSAKSSPPTMVRLLRVQSSLSRNDVVSALEDYGKIKSFLMFRSKQEAMVCFEKAEDAKKLLSIKSVDVKGIRVLAVRKTDAAPVKQKMPSQTTSVPSSASKLQTSKSSTMITTSRKAPLKPQVKGISSSGLKKVTKGKGIATKTGAKVLVKGQMTVKSASKVLVSKAKNVSAKQVAKTVKAGKLPVKGAMKKLKKRRPTLKSAAPEKQPDVAHLEEKPIPVKCETITEESMVLVKETVNHKSTEGSTIRSEELFTEGKIFKSETASTEIQSQPEIREEPLAGEVVCVENVEGMAAKDAGALSKSTTLENQADGEHCKEVEDLVTNYTSSPPKYTSYKTEPSVENSSNFEVWAVKDLSTPSKSSSSGDQPDGENSKNVEDTETKAIHSPSNFTGPYNQPTAENSGNVEDMAVKDLSSPLQSTYLEDQPHIEKSEARVQEPEVETKDVEPENMARSEPEDHANRGKASEASNTEPMLTGQNRLEDAELMEVETHSEDQEEKMKTLEVVQEHSGSHLPSTADETCLTKTTVEALQHVHQKTLSELAESTSEQHETKTDTPQVLQLAAGSSTVTAEKTELLGGDVKTEANLKDPVTEVKTQKNSSSEKDTSAIIKAKAATASKRLPAVSMPSSAHGTKPTIGELVDRRLDPSKIVCLSKETYTSPHFLNRGSKVLLITKLPRYADDCYTEKEVAEVLMPFGFNYTNENIYIVPQREMGFVEMPNVESMLAVMKAFRNEGIYFKRSRLCFGVIASTVSVTPLGIYIFLMRLMKQRSVNGDRVIFIRNISQSKATELNAVWKQNSNMWNFFPLLNKVFIEFWTNLDADRFGVWYHLQIQDPGYEILRLKVPRSYKLYSPKAPLERKDVVEGITIPPIHPVIPRGSSAPFWITTGISPFLFPTSFPWFNIPDHLTLRKMEDIGEAGHRGSMFPTIMLTGLPETPYRHESIARLVWPYLPKQNLHSLYYNVIVLPLQRRAFLFFADWVSCCDFAREHLAYPFFVEDCKLTVHFVLQHIHPECSEEMMYSTMMKWSHAGASLGIQQPDSLQERLLCVETSETSADTVRMVVEVVASFAPFVGFLPLANRICIEMADSASLTKVLENYQTFSPDSYEKGMIWSNVQRFETVQKIKQRLQEASEITLNLDHNTDDALLQAYNKDFLKTITVTVYQNKEGQSEEEVEEVEAESPSKNSTRSSSTTYNSLSVAPDDFTADTLSSDVYLFDDQNFNMDDFVTVDEVGDGVEDTPPKSHGSSSSQSRERGERQSCDMLSSSRRTSSRLCKSSSSSSASKSYKESSDSSSVSFKMATDSSASSQSPTKPRTSSRVSKPSSSSSLPTEAITSTGHKKQAEKSESLPEASNTASGLGTCSFSAATMMESVDIHPKQLEKETKETEGVVPEFDHKVAQEGTAEKHADSETIMETSSFNDNTFGEQKECKEERNKGDADKHVEEKKDASGNDQILDSHHDRMDKQVDDKNQEDSSETQQSALEESFQVLDSVTDEGNIQQEEGSGMDIGDSLQEPGNRPEDKEALGQEDDSSTSKQVFECDENLIHNKSECKSAVKGAGGGDCLSLLDTGMAEDTKNLEIPNENRPCQGLGRKDDPKDSDGNFPEQETFEVLDSIGDQTATEEDRETLFSCDQSSEHISSKEEEQEDTYQVIDSLEDQPVATEAEPETDSKDKGTKTARGEDGASRRSGSKTTDSKDEHKEKSPLKCEITIKKYETRRKTDTIAGVQKKHKEMDEEVLYEIVDSVEEEPDQVTASTEKPGRRRSARGKKANETTSNLKEASETPIRDEEASFKILDETVHDESRVRTRSTRGKRDRQSKKEALTETTKKEDTPTRRRNTPARESKERNREETPQKESAPTKSDPDVGEDETSFEILDSVEEEVVEDVRPKTGRKRGRPRKDAKMDKKESAPPKKNKQTSEKVVEEEEVTYQILDSVEDEIVDDQPLAGPPESCSKCDISTNNGQTKSSKSGSTKNDEEEEEEPVYQILDSVEEDQEGLMVTQVSGENKNEQNDCEELVDNQETSKCVVTSEEVSKTVIISEETLYEIVDDLQKVNKDPSTTDDSVRSKKKSPPRTQSKKEEKYAAKEETLKSPKENLSSPLKLDRVSDEEEDFPDDDSEVEEMRKKQVASRQRQEAKIREKLGTKKMEGRSKSSGRGSRGRTRRGQDREEEEEKEEEEEEELVILDEEGADESQEERTESQKREEENAETAQQMLVTLDEFVEEEDGKVEQSLLETRPLCQEDESADSFNPETLVTLDEAGDDEEEKVAEDQTKQTATKCKHSEDTEENMNFVTVDEVGEEEEEEVTHCTRGQPPKRTKETTVRKSTRGKKKGVNNEGEEEKEANDEPAPSSLKPPSSLNKEEEEVVSQARVNAASGGQEVKPQLPEKQTVEGGEEGKEEWSRADIKAESKQRRELLGPEAKRSRSASPCVTADFKLPPFKPNNPLGQEFVVPASGFFCNLCSVFYLNKSMAKERHCSSRRHYDSLQKHYQKHLQRPSQPSAQSSQSLTSK